MNFAQSVVQMIHRHGINSTYSSVTTGVYDVNTSTVTNTSTNYVIKIYMKHIKQNQYNYPNLVGKDAGMFYIAAPDITFVPKAQDLITYNSKTYKVDSIQSHTALGSVILYRIIGVAQ